MGFPVFKPYTQDQAKLLPPSLEDLIPAAHPVRVVNSVIDSLDLSALSCLYEGGGASSYHPAMLLKVTVYGYLRGICSARRLEEAVHENIHFMWLAGDCRPDHNTLARFRSQRLKAGLRSVFTQVVFLLVEKGLVSLEEAYLDGTKIEANAGRYTFVWGKSVKTSRAKLISRLNELMDYAEKLAGRELGFEPAKPEEVTPEEAAQAAQEISRILKEQKAPAKERAKARVLANTCQGRLEKLDEQERILDGRNSYSKTDHDAVFMRMKEDHMNSGQLKAGYNVQISTQGQCVLHYSVHRTPGDTKTLPSHLTGLQENLGRLPARLVADAGYGSLENYEHLEAQGVEAFVKDQGFSGSLGRPDPYDSSLWPFDEESESLVCPAGRQMRLHHRQRDGSLVFISDFCQECPLKADCCRGRSSRRASRSSRMDELRGRARERLKTEEGSALRKRRCVEPESVFGNIKHNHGFRRLHLRGQAGAEIEMGLVFLGQNLRKLAA
jgi:transposase